MSRFKNAIDVILAQEGGYVNDPDDPGGETQWGISKRSYPDINIKELSRAQAIEIYRRDYWEPNKIASIRCQTIANKHFSFVVNMGARSAGRILQRALRAIGIEVEIDGRVGPVTRRAINDATKVGGWTVVYPTAIYALLAAIRSEAAGHYRLLIEKNSRLERFRNGWMNRAYE